MNFVTLPEKSAHDGVHALTISRVFIHAFKQILGRPVRNIFVETGAGLLLREQEFTISVRELEGHVAEEEHFATLKLVTVP